MDNDRLINISTGSSRRATTWAQEQLKWSEFVARLARPRRTAETLADYKALPKPKQDELKDVGGFVGGTLTGQRRKNDNAGLRDLVTLDADNIRAGETEKVLEKVEGLGCGYVVYSTRKHEPAVVGRLRIITLLDRPVDPEQYEAIARKLAEMIGIEIFDPTTFEPVRLMYWPSCSADSDYVYRFADKPMLSAAGMLGLYTDWRDVSSWPEVPGAQKLRDRAVKRQVDPLTKAGVIGAFCRKYGILEALAEYLPGTYLPTEQADRWTYSRGSTVGGAVIYDNKYLYSHHATDPCSMQLVNSFDLVRLHLYGDLDDEAKMGTPTTSLPSFKAMCQKAAEDEDVRLSMIRDSFEKPPESATGPAGAPADAKAAENTAGGAEGVTEAKTEDWRRQLKIDPNTLKAQKTADNIQLILRCDERLKDRWFMDEFLHRILVVGDLPWSKESRLRPWSDIDDAGLRNYMESAYGIVGKEKIADGFDTVTDQKKIHRVREYLGGLAWDGVKRVDNLLVDYFGADDNAYTHETIRKVLVAAVARVFEPGRKFDNMLILVGAQGIGKSTFWRYLGKEWFSDSMITFEGKDAMEQLQGNWILEVAELEGFNRSELNAVKNFLSKTEDQYREAYGRRKSVFPRQCVIVGTTNEGSFLRDRTGNRRFWPVDIHESRATKRVFDDLPKEVDQIWAEAVVLYRLGVDLYLTGEAAEIAAEEQDGHRADSVNEGAVAEYLDTLLPDGWERFTKEQRRSWFVYTSDRQDTPGNNRRMRVCLAEIWNECFQVDPARQKAADNRELGAIMETMKGWRRTGKVQRVGGGYGPQKIYERVLFSGAKTEAKKG